MCIRDSNSSVSGMQCGCYNTVQILNEGTNSDLLWVRSGDIGMSGKMETEELCGRQFMRDVYKRQALHLADV